MRPLFAMVLLFALGTALGLRLGGPAAERGATLAREGALRYARGDWLGSADSYARAAATARDESEARAWRAQSAVGLKMGGRHAEARALMAPVLEEARAAGDVAAEGLALGNLARLADLLGEPEESLRHLDELAELAERQGDERLAVWTLEQAAHASLQLGDLSGTERRIARALALDEALPDEDRRGDPLRRLLAWVLVERGDDEGALAAWGELPSSAAGLANQARFQARLGRHALAADFAQEAARGFAQEGATRGDERDRVVLLHLSELLAAGELDTCAGLLDAALGNAGAEDLAPLEVLRARLLLARGDPAAAAGLLASVASRGAELPELPLLRAVALRFADDAPGARAVLADSPPGRARDLLLAWSGDASVALDPLAADLEDRSLAALREVCPQPLPSLAWVIVERAVTDLGTRPIAAAVRDALLWQAIELLERLPGTRLAREELAAGAARAQRWVDGELAEDEAIVALLPGETGSFLLICTRELGATSFGLGPRRLFAQEVLKICGALHGSDLRPIVEASHELFDLLFPGQALVDLEGKERLTLIWPDLLTPVPPAMLATGKHVDGVPEAWWVRERTIGLLPHALAGGPWPQRDGEWVQIGQPQVDRNGLPLAGTSLLERYGDGLFKTGPLRAGSDGGVTGPAATVAALRLLAQSASVLEISVPGAGGGRLGGLLFSPETGVDRSPLVTEQKGFLPWHRLAQLELPPLVILDRTRFDPGDAEHGAAQAAAAAMRSARAVLLARWPSPLPPEVLPGAIIEALGLGASLPQAVALAQRRYLDTFAADGGHPRAWAPWLPFASD